MTKDKVKRDNIENLIKQIQNIIEELETGEVDLDEAIKKYETSMILIEKCKKILKDSRLKVEILKKKMKDNDENTEEGSEENEIDKDKDDRHKKLF